MLDRDFIIERAVHNCFRELYRRAQPRANYDEYLRKIKNGEISEEEHPIYTRHYLPQKEYLYVVDKYVRAYGLKKQWTSNVDVIIDNIKTHGYKETYVNNSLEYEHPKLKDQIGEENVQKVIKFIEDLKNFYMFDREESDFRCRIALGCSPTSNPETVKEYWKTQGVEISIDEKKNLDENDYWDLDYYGHIIK